MGAKLLGLAGCGVDADNRIVLVAVDSFTHFDRQNRPISVDQWALLYGDLEYRFVLRTRVEDIAWVITLWDGMDPYRLPCEGDPNLIFETTVFRPGGENGIHLDEGAQRWDADTDLQRRDATEDEALRFHWEMVDKLRGEITR